MTPNFGGYKGGTEIQITGANFMQSGGLGSSISVFIGNSFCEVIDYYTTDRKIICITPPCETDTCNNQENWGGNEVVNLNVYIGTVEGIYGDAATFNYVGYSTPLVTRMSHITWGSATSYIAGRTGSKFSDDYSIKIGSQFAYLGDNDELNPEIFNDPSNTQNIVYYRPPKDMKSGFENLTFAVQNEQSRVVDGTGYANMYPDRKPSDFIRTDNPYTYNFDASLSGTVFSIALLPTITSVIPSKVSVAGGAIVTIQGSGFPTDIKDLTVFASGRFCDVINSTVDVITCVTRPLSNVTLNKIVTQAGMKSTGEWIRRQIQANSTRDSGSPGWWVNIWNPSNPSNIGKISAASYSFPWHQGAFFSMNYEFGNKWPQIIGVSSYVAFLRSTMIVPYSGLYTFYVSGGNIVLYMSKKIVNTGTDMTPIAWGPESQLATDVASDKPGNYYANIGQKSIQIRLKRGENIRLRIKAVSLRYRIAMN